MPCSPNDISIPSPTGPSGSPIPAVGIPFALNIPSLFPPIPAGFPEDLLDLFNNFQFLIPPGILKPSLNPNFSKDIFDTILSMLDQFFPFLMLYKFFLPILNLIICIIEVLCALMNPFALISAINNLFNNCIPAFLNLFPIFALVIMIISLLKLLLALIEYLISQILKLVQDVLRNINALVKAFQDADANAVLAIAQKLGALLCSFQNLFVLLSIFNVIIEVIQDILRLSFAIPPCGDSQSGSTSGCCSTTTCPEIIKNQYTNLTGTLQYLPEAGIKTNQEPIPFFGDTTFDLRTESWQIYDLQQTIPQAFINIINAYDIPSSVNPKPIFFPTDSTYNASTPPNQAPYTLDLRLYYNPTSWHRTGAPRYIRLNSCIVQFAPTSSLKIYDNSDETISNGVFYIVGGAGYEDDNSTILTGFAADGVTPISSQATLENFLHMPAEFVYNPTSDILQSTDGYTFQDATYTFNPNVEVLFNKQIATLGCIPSISFTRTFVNTVLYGDIGLKTVQLSGLLGVTSGTSSNANNGGGTGASSLPSGVPGVGNTTFPDPNAALACLTDALNGLRTNLTAAGVAQFQASTTACLNQLASDTNSALSSLVSIGFNPCQSNLSRTPQVQFTSRTIQVTVDLNDNNGIPLTAGLPASVGDDLASRLTPYISFGVITPFAFDGYQSFNAQISSTTPGSGQISVAFDNQILCTNLVSPDPTVAPVHTLQALDYQFIYTPSGTVIPVPSSGAGDTSDGAQPRRDEGDISRDGTSGGSRTGA